ncbi:hypothetical protein [Demequina litorisediminis]|uniref:Uncharacterized protein n=1 Tax=Demequina litorisediminis TaxID=1849022 RepID=A0ABQ6IAK2_9MICO|nr:hypothetical protein [Demequina litorisediminis]GMA34012.1 hypothetical protein GCM10025876_02160 [Demequina litorisediminis]
MDTVPGACLIEVGVGLRHRRQEEVAVEVQDRSAVGGDGGGARRDNGLHDPVGKGHIDLVARGGGRAAKQCRGVVAVAHRPSCLT